MPQIVASIDEASVNLLFRKFYNALPALPVSRSANKTASAVGVSLQLSANAQAQITPVHYMSSLRPVDLRGSTLVPAVQIGPMAFKVQVTLNAKAVAGQFNAATNVTAEMLVNVNAGASVRVLDAGTEWRPQIRLQATSVQVELDANKAALQGAVEAALKQIDANGSAPGKPQLPAAVISALVGLAGQVFDQLVSPLEEGIEQAIKLMLGDAAIDVSIPLPKQFAMALPGGGLVQVGLVNPSIAVSADRATVSADLS